ncbi:DUF2213 domain-containing protein [Sessilibacter corallicola]|uniref:DUF2213 domain-containing protein n=1 Tax=Sessilibacter corallicola TaxID=2904075 RepID=UPI001E33F74D|nr:DUF2213 domain-containing protein [Sessilibacter corallicola]MCE2029283.1 DUF2213 domain-containing protein [Sessilibacter corallicola]
MRILVNDRASYVITERVYLDNGYLRVPGRVARTGIQEYLASELGLKDRNPNDIVRVYRPPEEVFKQESLDTYKSVDVTIEHPAKMVDTETFKKVSAGHAESVGSTDGDFVVCDLIIKDKAAIKAVEQGKVQLSAGYTSFYDNNVPEGADYEFIQRDIRINHVALVDAARAGPQARLFDNKPGGNKKMPYFVTLDSGTQVEVADEAAAMKINSQIESLKQENKDMKSKMSDMEEGMEKEKAEKDAMKEDLKEEKKKSSDAAIAKRMGEIIKVRDTAKKIAGGEFSCDSLDVVEIQKAALSIARESVDWDSKSNAYISAAFDMEAEKEESDEDMEEKKKANDSYRRLAGDAEKIKPAKASEFRDSFEKKLTSAWKDK